MESEEDNNDTCAGRIKTTLALKRHQVVSANCCCLSTVERKMADSSDENSMDTKTKVPPGPIVHVRADSDSTLEALFDIALKPPGTQTPLQVPLRMRNLPASFFKPPLTGGSRSPSCHSRENSLDSTNLSQQQQQQQQHQQQQPYSPGVNVIKLSVFVTNNEAK